MSPTPEATAYSKLTEKQQAFVDALLLQPNLSGKAAAIQAGYAAASAEVEASRLLRSAKVRQALGEALTEVAPTANEIAARWDRVAQATVAEFYSLEEYEEATRVQRPLLERISDLEYEYDFEQRVVDKQTLTAEQKFDFALQQQRRRNAIIRLEVELEMNPAATYETAGPPEKKTRLVLDLVRAEAAGVLDLVKSIKPTQYGLAVELRDPDAALDKLARMAGAYEKDNEQSRSQVAIIEVVAPPARKEPRGE